jgi:hypothetical protein
MSVSRVYQPQTGAFFDSFYNTQLERTALVPTTAISACMASSGRNTARTPIDRPDHAPTDSRSEPLCTVILSCDSLRKLQRTISPHADT